MRPGQRCGSRGRCVLRRLHLPNCKTLRGGSWEGAYTETVRGTDCNFPQEWHGLTDCRGKQEATKVAWVYVSFGQWFKLFRVTCTQLKYRVALNVTILIFAIFVFFFVFMICREKFPPRKKFSQKIIPAKSCSAKVFSTCEIKDTNILLLPFTLKTSLPFTTKQRNEKQNVKKWKKLTRNDRLKVLH